MNPQEYLNSFINYEQHMQKADAFSFDLTRVNELLNLLGNPQKELKVIHVAGTKGKGSTCAFLSYILAAAGFRVGMYTSPHLHRLNERIRILDKKNIYQRDDFPGMITDDQLTAIINSIRPQIASMINRGMFLTYFEVLTVVALMFFKQQQLDFVVLETGLGGRLDATNVVDSLIAVLTPISLDHTKILGSTYEAIAAEKAGIIKSSKQRVVIAPQPPQAMAVILKRAQEFGIPPIVVDDKVKLDYSIGLSGDHQQINAATALKTIELLRQWNYAISDEAIKDGLHLTSWPGRMEILRHQPTIVIDGAHNHASALCLARTLLDNFKERQFIFVIGLSADKDIAGFMHELRPVLSTVILTKADHPRAHAFTPDEAGQFCHGKKWSIVNEFDKALALALSKASPKDVIVITGSLFIVAQARSALSTVSKV